MLLDVNHVVTLAACFLNHHQGFFERKRMLPLGTSCHRAQPAPSAVPVER